MIEVFEIVKLTWLFTFLSFFIIPFLPQKIKAHLFILLVLINSITSTWLVAPALTGNNLEFSFYAGTFFQNIPVRIDGLSAWFVVIVNFTTLMGGIYGIGYMKPYSEQKSNTTQHWILFVIFHISMLWVCMLQHGFAFLVAWEIMSISSLLLVVFEQNKKETVKAGINYMIQMHIGVAVLSLAFIWIYFSVGSFDFKAIAHFFDAHPPYTLFLLFFIGFGIKAGFIPFHTWLPHAHPAAPSHVSGVMSGVIVKMGIYGILRIVSYMNTGLLLVGEILLTLSIITALYGILNSSVHRNFKKMLAFCTIENIGIIGMGIAIGMIGKAIDNQFIMFAGFAGALIHTLNHSLFKSLLFFTAGNVYSATHTRNMEYLGGLIKKMPVTAIAFLIGALAIGGLPPFNGFVSEFLIYSGLIEGIKNENIQFSSLMIISVAALAMIGGLSMLTFTKTFGIIFLGTERKKPNHEPHEVKNIMLIPLFFIIAIIIAIGLFPGFLLKPLMSSLSVFSESFATGNILDNSFSILNKIGFTSLIFIVIVGVIYGIRMFFTKKQTEEINSTWGCGYIAGTPKIQYTGKSFSKSLAKLFSFVVAEKKEYQEIENSDIFPKKRKFDAIYTEFFESKFIDNFNKKLLKFIDLFSFIHNGKIQLYILYGIFFMILVIILTTINIL